MREKLRYALIGCGRIAPNHIAAYLNNAEDLELCAVCDPVSERMEAVLRPLPEQDRARVRRYTDHRELLAKEAPQLCAVATESGLHAQVGLDVLRAGSNVIIEKPLALSMADARALVAAARAKGVKLCACHQNRFRRNLKRPDLCRADKRSRAPIARRAGIPHLGHLQNTTLPLHWPDQTHHGQSHVRP